MQHVPPACSSACGASVTKPYERPGSSGCNFARRIDSRAQASSAEPRSHPTAWATGSLVLSTGSLVHPPAVQAGMNGVIPTHSSHSTRPIQTHFISKLQVPMEHSGAMSWSLKEDMEAAENSLVSCTGHLNPKDENTDTSWNGAQKVVDAMKPTSTNFPAHDMRGPRTIFSQLLLISVGGGAFWASSGRDSHWAAMSPESLPVTLDCEPVNCLRNEPEGSLLRCPAHRG